MRCQRLERETQEFIDVQITRQIVLVIAFIFPLVVLAIHDAPLHQEKPPQIVAVPAQQGVIQIKYC